MIRCSVHILMAVLLGPVLLGGCSKGIDSGVEGSKPVSTLTEAEARDLCLAAADYLSSILDEGYDADRICTIQALGSSTTPEDCEAMRRACFEEPPQRDDVDCSRAGPFPDCDATVDSVEACYTAEIDAYASKLDEADCSLAGNLPALMALMTPPPVPSECVEAGAMACNDLSDGLFDRGD